MQNLNSESLTVLYNEAVWHPGIQCN